MLNPEENSKNQAGLSASALKNVFSFLSYIELSRSLPLSSGQFYRVSSLVKNAQRILTERSLLRILSSQGVTQRNVEHLFKSTSLFTPCVYQTLFSESCRMGLLSMVQILTNEVYSSMIVPGARALYFSVRNGHTEVVMHLLRLRYKPVNPAKPFLGNYPIIVACSYGTEAKYDDIVKILLNDKRTNPAIKHNLALRRVCRLANRSLSVKLLIGDVRVRAKMNEFHELALRISVRYRLGLNVREFLRNDHAEIGSDALSVVKIGKVFGDVLMGKYLSYLGNELRVKYIHGDFYDARVRYYEQRGEERWKVVRKLTPYHVVANSGFQSIIDVGEGVFVRLSRLRKMSAEVRHALFEKLFEIDHPNMVQVRGLFNLHDDYYLLTECFQGGTCTSLAEYIREDQLLTDVRIMKDLKLLHQIVEIVEYLHSRKIFMWGNINVNTVSVTPQGVKLDMFFGEYIHVDSEEDLIQHGSSRSGFMDSENGGTGAGYSGEGGGANGEEWIAGYKRIICAGENRLTIPERNFLAIAPEQIEACLYPMKMVDNILTPIKLNGRKIDVYGLGILMYQLINRRVQLFEDVRLRIQNENLDHLESYVFQAARHLHFDMGQKRPPLQQFPEDLVPLLREIWKGKREEYFGRILTEILPVNVYNKQEFVQRKKMSVEERRDEMGEFLGGVLQVQRNDFGARVLVERFWNDILAKFDWKKVRKRMKQEAKERQQQQKKQAAMNKKRGKEAEFRKTLGSKKLSFLLGVGKMTNTHHNVKKAVEGFRTGAWNETFEKYWESCLLPRLTYEWECRACRFEKTRDVGVYKEIKHAFDRIFFTPLQMDARSTSNTKKKRGKRERKLPESQQQLRPSSFPIGGGGGGVASGSSEDYYTKVKNGLAENWEQLTGISTNLELYPYPIFDLMRRCWEADARKRASVKEVKRTLSRLMYLEENKVCEMKKAIQRVQVERECVEREISDSSKTEVVLGKNVVEQELKISKLGKEKGELEKELGNLEGKLNEFTQKLESIEKSIAKHASRTNNIGQRVIEIQKKRNKHIAEKKRLGEEEELTLSIIHRRKLNL